MKKNDDEISVDLSWLRRKGRYAVSPNGYVIDRYLVRAFSLIVVITCLATLIHLGGFKQYAYAYCPDDAIGGFCDNPLYGACDLAACEREVLLPGEVIGEKPPGFAGMFFFIFLAGIIIMYVNHFGQSRPDYEEARRKCGKE